MKLLILGSSGLLGSELAAQAYAAGLDYIGASKSGHGGTVSCDISTPGSVSSLIAQYKPDVVVNCAALTNLILCQTSPELANNLHVKMLRELANCGKRIIHISTDSVFSGETGNYSENDTPEPLNYYAKSKFNGEAALDLNRDLIIRTNIFGRARFPTGNSFYDWILRQSEYGEISGYTNIFFNPVSVNTLSSLILDRFIKETTGLINVGTCKGVSKFEFIAKVLKSNGCVASLHPTSYIDFDVMRPRNTILNVEKLAREFGLSLDIDNEIEKVNHATSCC